MNCGRTRMLFGLLVSAVVVGACSSTSKTAAPSGTTGSTGSTTAGSAPSGTPINL
jgi:hypothetical protein